MRTIAIINQKGGVGKTTTAVNVSAALARSGQRVGLIDIDPQAHASLHLGLDPRSSVPTVYDLLTEETPIADLWQRAGSSPTPEEENLWVAASHIDLAAVEVELAGVVGREVILRDKLAQAANEFDFILIDCPPSLGILTINALAAADDVFLPLQPHFLALHGLSKLLKTIGLVNERLNDRLQLAGVVLCLYESGTKLAAEVSRDVEQFFKEARKGGRARAPCDSSKRASDATSALPSRPALASRSSSTPPTHPAPKTTAPSAAKCSPITPAGNYSNQPPAPPPDSNAAQRDAVSTVVVIVGSARSFSSCGQ